MVEHAAAEPPQDDKEFALPAELPLPRQFGKYTLLRKLAAGGMAELFLALHRSVAGFEKLIVIKTILPSMNQDRSFIDMLLHEARLSATLSHTNIVQVYDVGQVEGRYFIAMEHIHGEDIRSIIRAMKKKAVTEFPLEHALSIILGVCAGLAYAHEKRDLDGALLNIVHRDISPQNIVVTFTGDVKIVDFGIAKSETQSGEDTKSGQLKGKVPYMSPEQAAGEPIDWRSDIFAAGVLLFELTTGKRLFKGASEYETLRLICEKEYPLPTVVKAGYPEHLERIVMRALAKRREDRYQSAREMQSDLEDFIREERIKVSNVALMNWMQMLFEAKLAQQKEALQDVKQLADIIASQHGSALSDGSGGTIVTNSGLVSAPGSSSSVPVPAKRSSAGIVIALMALLGAAAGGFLYMRNQGLARERAAQAAAAAEAAKERPPEVEQAKGTLDIKSSPEGCAIWLNGDLRQEVTPAKIEGLPFGRELALKLTKEGLEAYRETITLTEGAPSKTINAEMRAGSVTVILKVDPPPTIWLDNKPLKGTRTKLEGLSADEEHKLVLSANGFMAKTITFVAKQGETKVIEERLTRLEGGGAPPAGGGDEPKAGGASAKVRVGSKGGFCNVTINGAAHGSTPVEAVVTPGTVRVSCKPSTGASQSQTVKVGAGETARVSFKLE